MAVALAVLQMKPTYSELEHPMLFESIRKQKGDLTMELLTRNSDSVDRCNLILHRFLDPDVHCIYA